MGSLGPVEILFIVVLWIAPAIAVALYASRKGYSYPAFVIIALLVSWPIALIGAAFAPDRSQRAA
jgi:hypothetical protein